MKINDREIDLVLFDLDDTLLDTNKVFQSFILPAIDKMSEVSNSDIKEFKETYQKLFLKSREKHHVHHIPLWKYTLELLGNEFPQIDMKVQREVFDQLMQIYTSTINPKVGAMKVLDKVNNANVKKGIVSNADADWTWFKLEKAGMKDYFKKESVYIVPPKIKKGTQHWKNAIENEQVDAQKVVIIGDNFKADILPAIELKSLPIYLFEKDNNAGMHAFGRDEFPDAELIEISDLNSFNLLIT